MTSKDQDEEIIRLIQINNKKSWEELKTVITNELGITMSVDSIIRRAHEVDIRGFKAIKKPKLTEKQAEKRMAFATRFLEHNVEFWENVTH